MRKFMTAPQREALRRFVRFLYDCQRLRVAAEGRGKKKADHAPVELAQDDVAVLDGLGEGLTALERDVLKQVALRVKAHPAGRWLMGHGGIGPTMAGVLLSEIDIERAPNVSSLWKFAGLDVVAGRGRGRWSYVKGEKRSCNEFLKMKVVGVMGDCILKACVRVARPAKGATWTEAAWEASRGASTEEEIGENESAVDSESSVVDERTGLAEQPEAREYAVSGETSGEVERAEQDELPVGHERLVRRFVTGYARVYADRRWRRLHQVGPCHLCAATGRISRAREGRAWSWKPAAAGEKAKPCFNCEGMGTGPWGKSSAHRHRDAIRHMVKIVLKDLWLVWRAAEGLPIPPPYSVAKLGMREHAVLGDVVDAETAEEPESSERAAVRERAEEVEKRNDEERAGRREATSISERADAAETTVIAERAVIVEKTDEAERADLTETTAPGERATAPKRRNGKRDSKNGRTAGVRERAARPTTGQRAETQRPEKEQ